MSSLSRKNVATPDETRPFKDGKGRIEVMNLRSGPVGKATFEPGWRWSDHVKPIAGTTSCQVAHAGYVISRRTVIRMDDGREMEIGPGDMMEADPGHDAWVVGDEPCVIVDWFGATNYAKG